MTDNSYWVVTTGAGVLPSGVRVGIIHAESPKKAKEQLRDSNQVGLLGPDKFDYILVVKDSEGVIERAALPDH